MRSSKKFYNVLCISYCTKYNPGRKTNHSSCFITKLYLKIRNRYLSTAIGIYFWFLLPLLHLNLRQTNGVYIIKAIIFYSLQYVSLKIGQKYWKKICYNFDYIKFSFFTTRHIKWFFIKCAKVSNILFQPFWHNFN